MKLTNEIIASMVGCANKVAAFIPVAGVVGQGINLAQKIIGIIDDIGDEDATLDQQAELQAARRRLSGAVKAKASATADRLRGQTKE